MTWEDFKVVDLNMYSCLKEIEKMDENNLEYLEETFVTNLFDTSATELKPNGKNILLT